MTSHTASSSSAEDAPDFLPAAVDAQNSEKGVALDADKSDLLDEDPDEKPVYVNGEPVISTGSDVSKFLVDLRDDGDPPLTFRSLVLGTVFGSLGAALYQVCVYSPTCLSIGTYRTLAIRFIFSSQLPRGSHHCFFSSSITPLVFSCQKVCQRVLW
jgi:hypothetical protein